MTGGPVHTVVYSGRRITATWFDAPFRPWRSRVYGLCFTEDGQLALARPVDDAGLYPPGGGVEDGESPEEALAREMLEEIAGRVEAHTYLGCQRVDDPEDPAGPHSDFHLYYWCRVRLETFAPNAEIAERRLIRPEDFLDDMAWSEDPAAAIMIERALVAERRYSSS